VISLALDEDHAACAMSAAPTSRSASTAVPLADPGRAESLISYSRNYSKNYNNSCCGWTQLRAAATGDSAP
jgi:hypothetical protein